MHIGVKGDLKGFERFRKTIVGLSYLELSCTIYVHIHLGYSRIFWIGVRLG